MSRAWCESRPAIEIAQPRLSRRRFLRAAAASVALAACRAPRAPASPRLDVGVVGAGLAGLHAAHLLDRTGIDVSVFEAAGAVGGRMRTARGLFGDGQVAELGGELVDTGHASLRALARSLEIPLDDVEADGPSRDVFHFGGRALRDEDVVEAFRPVAVQMARAMERADEPAIIAALDRKSIAEWLDAVAEATPLARSILREAYTGEYGLDPEEQSSLNLLMLIDYETPDPFRVYGDSDERYRIRGGSDSLTTRLAQSLAGRIDVGMRLEVVTVRSDGRIRLGFERDGTTFDRTFDRVVLAIPFTVLRDVEIRAPLPADKRRAIRELGYGTNAKVIGACTSRVWRTHGSSGTAFTDNGLGNVWDGARGQPGHSGILTVFSGGRLGVRMGDGAPEERMRAALPLVDAIFPGTSGAYRAGSAIRMHWPSAPLHRGSYACYRPGQWSFRGVEGRPEGNLHFCGEHCSLDFQGYMEGACESGARVAREILAAI